MDKALKDERAPSFLGRYSQFERQYLTSDLSPRKYFRWRHGDTSLVLMDCPDLDCINAFINVGNYLIRQGLSAPEIIETDLDNGFLLLEDFGDSTFTKVLQENLTREHKIYSSAVDVLIHLQERSSEKLPFLKDYTVDFGLGKVQQFLTHYYPEILKQELNNEAHDDFIKVWKNTIGIALQAKKSIYLRDYHVDNLMDLSARPAPKNIGVLDFQDAIWGPIAMDLLGLIEDARRDVSDELTDLMWKRFLDAHPKGDHQEIIISGNILSALRHARIIGLFTRVAKEKADKRFLSRIPHLWKLFERCCNKIQELQPVKQWFDTYVPHDKRVIPNL